jgi:hypothetical protein
VAFSGSEFDLRNLRIYFVERLVGLLGQGISYCVHRTAQHRKTWTHIHASSGIRTHDPTVRMFEDLAAIGTAARKVLLY